jgi:hypothetical protein
LVFVAWVAKVAFCVVMALVVQLDQRMTVLSSSFYGGDG